jgi:hypothetical protein
MKIVTNQLRWTLLCFAGLTLMVVGGRAEAASHAFIAVMNAAQEVPPGEESSGQGLAFITLDTATGELCYAVSYQGLVAEEVAAHIHGPAAPGVNADVLFGLPPLGSPKNGCVGPLSAQHMRYIRDGLLYVNVHTTEYPGGEIRGQLMRVGQIPTTGPSSPGRLPLR